MRFVMNDELLPYGKASNFNLQHGKFYFLFFTKCPSVLSVTIYCLREEKEEGETEIIIVSLKVCAALIVDYSFPSKPNERL